MMYVVFTPHNARIIKNPSTDLIDQFVNDPNVICNPDLSQVHGVPPHYWKLSGNRVLPMGKEEMLLRDKVVQLSAFGKSIQQEKPYEDEKVVLLQGVAKDTALSVINDMGLMGDSLTTTIKNVMSPRVGTLENQLNQQFSVLDRDLGTVQRENSKRDGRIHLLMGLSGIVMAWIMFLTWFIVKK